MLKGPGHGTHLECDRNIKLYIKQHIDSWYDYGRYRRGMDIRMRDILFVYGFVKTSAWAVAAFQQCSSSGKVDIHAGFTPVPSVRFKIAMAQDSQADYSFRAGPGDRLLGWNKGQGNQPSDQCIFLRY